MGKTISPQDHCCPPLNIERWNDKNHLWMDKPFLKANVRQIFHMPLNFGSVVGKMYEKAELAGAAPEEEDFLLLVYDPSPWQSELYMAITKDIPNEEVVTLSGEFYSKVYDGPYQSVPIWIDDLETALSEKNLKALKIYFHYAYCPDCAKKYGHNHCVGFAALD